MADDKIWVAIYEHTAFARVQGRASFRISGALKQFGTAAMEAGCTLILFDMEHCVGMDSTFMGTLAGVASRLKRELGGDMVLLNMAPRTRGLVATLGLDQIVQAYETGITPEPYQALLTQSQQMVALEAGPEDRQTAARNILQAHEDLCAVDPRNLPRFKDVLAFLREDVKKAESSPN